MDSDKSIQKAKEVLGAHEVVTDERYEYLLQDLQNIVKMTVRICRDEIIKSKWEMGARIVQEFADQENREYGGIIERLSGDLKVSESELYRCVEFKLKYPNLDEALKLFPEGENISWNKIKETYLPHEGLGRLELSFPHMESIDLWGIVSWWEKNPDQNFVLYIKDPKYKTQLKVSIVNASEESKTPLQEAFKFVIHHYLTAKNYNLADLDASDYTRIRKSVRHLILKSKGDLTKIKKAIDWVASRDYVEWEIETVVKKYAEAMREVPEYAKYLKKGGRGGERK